MSALYIPGAYRSLTLFANRWYAFGRNGILDPMRAISGHGNGRRISQLFVLHVIAAR
jgi:hypothetical protein